MSEEKNSDINNQIKDKEQLLITRDGSIKLVISIGEEIHTNLEKIFNLMDFVDRVSNFFDLRSKYNSLFNVLPEIVLFSSIIEKWFEWEQVLLLIFTKYPFPIEREYIWNHDIKKLISGI